MSRPSTVIPQQPLLLWDRLAKRTLQRCLSHLSRGELVVRDRTGRDCFGGSDDLSAVVHVHNPRFYRYAVFGGTLSIAESYLNGDWDCVDLTELFRVLIRNLDTIGRLDGPLAGVVGAVHRLYHAWHANTRRGSRQNIHAHYDLGNEFFKLWLDETLAYSCGIFPHTESPLRDASREKFDRVCRRLAVDASETSWRSAAAGAASRCTPPVNTAAR